MAAPPEPSFVTTTFASLESDRAREASLNPGRSLRVDFANGAWFTLNPQGSSAAVNQLYHCWREFVTAPGSARPDSGYQRASTQRRKQNHSRGRSCRPPALIVGGGRRLRPDMTLEGRLGVQARIINVPTAEELPTVSLRLYFKAWIETAEIVIEWYELPGRREGALEQAAAVQARALGS